MSTQTPQESTPPRFYVLTDADGRHTPDSLFGRPYNLAHGLETAEPVAQEFGDDDRRDRALSASTSVGRLLEFATWPLRNFEVEGQPLEDRPSSTIRFNRVTVVRELGTEELFGPDGAHVAALLDRVQALGSAGDRAEILRSIAEARPAAEDTVAVGPVKNLGAELGGVVRAASAVGSRTAYTHLALDNMTWFGKTAERAVQDAVTALATRHRIGSGPFAKADYDWLTGPVRAVLGPIHPDDPDAGTPVAELTPQYVQTVEIGGITVTLTLTGGELTVAVDDPAPGGGDEAGARHPPRAGGVRAFPLIVEEAFTVRSSAG